MFVELFFAVTAQLVCILQIFTLNSRKNEMKWKWKITDIYRSCFAQLLRSRDMTQDQSKRISKTTIDISTTKNLELDFE